jgi:hypothetical protein
MEERANLSLLLGEVLSQMLFNGNLFFNIDMTA